MRPNARKSLPADEITYDGIPLPAAAARSAGIFQSAARCERSESRAEREGAKSAARCCAAQTIILHSGGRGLRPELAFDGSPLCLEEQSLFSPSFSFHFFQYLKITHSTINQFNERKPKKVYNKYVRSRAEPRPRATEGDGRVNNRMP